MSYAIKLVSIAFLLYTGVIFTERFISRLTFKMVMVFALALVIDMVGSFLMAVNGNFKLNLHTVTGIFALVVMSAHFTWATMAHMEIGKAKQLFSTYSIYAWVFWLTVAMSGMFGS